jgi:glycosyltransferase involved in cell wall biosynthesis
VIFTGYQFAEAYQELQSHPLLYIQATEVGGTHPALIEAMAYGNCVIANGTPENLEVLGGAGEYYYRNDFDHLALRLRELCTDSDRRKEFGEAAKARAQERFSWEAIADRYEGLLRSITK